MILRIITVSDIFGIHCLLALCRGVPQIGRHKCIRRLDPLIK